MNAVTLDYFLIIAFLLLLTYIFLKNVVGIKAVNDIFKGGRNLRWIWIAVSLLGTNIQIEYILASASNGFTHGLALGSFEWMGSIALLYTAIYIVPFFLSSGVLTLPEYLEYRYGRKLRMIYSVIFMLVNLVMIMLILNSSATFLDKLFGIHPELTIIAVSVVGGVIIYLGGMKGKLKLDMVVIFTFLASGLAVLIFCFVKTGGIDHFHAHADGRLTSLFPADAKVLPWTSVVAGLTVTATFYHAFLPPIAQSFLAADSLSEAQKGLMFASTVKLLLPFILIVPGIIGYELFSTQISHPDFALPVVIQNVVPAGLRGLILTGYIGTLFTTYNSFLNSTSTIFTLDLYGKVTRDNPPTEKLIAVKQKFIPVFVIISILLGTVFKPSEVIFSYSQMLITHIAPMTTCVFLFALFSRRTPPAAAYVSTVLGIPLMFFFHSWLKLDLPMLNLSAITFLILAVMMGGIRFFFPLKEKVIMPEKLKVKFERNLIVVIWGIFILSVTAAIYVIFAE